MFTNELLFMQIVTREPKYYGLRDSSFKTSLMNWALPFAQRYMYSVHPNRYAELKQSEFNILSRLLVIVVEKLFFRNVIKNFGCASDEQVPCSCLLQVIPSLNSWQMISSFYIKKKKLKKIV